MLYELFDTALIMKYFFFLIALPFVLKSYFDTLVKKSCFSQSVLQSIVIVFCCFRKNLGIRPKSSFGTRFFGVAYNLKLSYSLALFIGLSVYFAVSFNFDFHTGGKGINN